MKSTLKWTCALIVLFLTLSVPGGTHAASNQQSGIARWGSGKLRHKTILVTVIGKQKGRRVAIQWH